MSLVRSGLMVLVIAAGSLYGCKKKNTDQTPPATGSAMADGGTGSAVGDMMATDAGMDDAGTGDGGTDDAGAAGSGAGTGDTGAGSGTGAGTGTP